MPSTIPAQLASPIGIHITRLLQSRTYPKTLCPSEAARSLSHLELQSLRMNEWREAMPAVRELVWEMRARGEVEVLQKGEVLKDDVKLQDVRGPIRVRLVKGNSEEVDQG